MPHEMERNSQRMGKPPSGTGHTLEAEGLEYLSGRGGTVKTPSRPSFNGSELELNPCALNRFGLASLQHWLPPLLCSCERQTVGTG